MTDKEKLLALAIEVRDLRIGLSAYANCDEWCHYQNGEGKKPCTCHARNAYFALSKPSSAEEVVRDYRSNIEDGVFELADDMPQSECVTSFIGRLAVNVIRGRTARQPKTKPEGEEG